VQKMSVAVHPGEALKLEIDARGLTGNALALALRVPGNRISEILAGRRGISAETALRLGRYFGTGPEIWLTMQGQYDLETARAELGEKIEREVQPAA
jgi:antitoxin HigA-1